MDRIVAISSQQNTPFISGGSNLFNADNIMQRDREQSRRLHEPTSISSHTDPVTGHDVMGTADHPYVVDGIMTVYFESEKTRNDYLNTPYNQPVLMLSSKPSSEDDRGG